MAWSRVLCPYCNANVALVPSTGRMTLHQAKTGQWCPGSHETPEEARIATLDADALAAKIRQGLERGPLPHDRADALAALDDLLALYQQCDEHDWRHE